MTACLICKDDFSNGDKTLCVGCSEVLTCDVCGGDLASDYEATTCPECLLIILINGSTEED